MPAAATPSSRSEGEDPVERNRALLLSLGVLVLVSAVIAAVVIVSGGGSSSRPAKPPVAAVSVTDGAVVVGDSSAEGGAGTEVVVFEDFGSSESREFAIASRDFLRIVAAQGEVVVEYRPVSLSGAGFSAAALAAWNGVLEQARPTQVLALHDLIFDRQPAAGVAAPVDFAAWAKEAGVKAVDVQTAEEVPDADRAAALPPTALAAGVRTTPTVLVDGEPLTADSPTALADRLQGLILETGSS